MGETKMESFGKAIPVTGPNTLEPKEPVWFSEVRILEHFLYICRPPMQCLNHAEAFSGVI